MGRLQPRVAMNYKRKKNKRSVRCTLCTPHKWMGNHSGRHDFKTDKYKEAADEQIRAVQIDK